MSSSYLRLIGVLFTILLFAVVPFVGAAEGDVQFTLDCSGLESNGGRITLTRDNTGGLSEAFVTSAIDGSGNTILEPVSDVFFIGGTVSIEAGDRIAWDNAPRHNPLYLQIVSPAGNGLEEQVIYEVAGHCAGLPNFGAIDILESFRDEALRRLQGEAFVLQPADGVTSASVELNSVPPRPINPEGLATNQPGHAIVNTDNLFLRSGDNFRYSVIGILDGGTELAVLGRNENRSWWYVQAGGLRGWVNSEYLILRGDLTYVKEVPVYGEYTHPSLYVGFTGNRLYAQAGIGAPTLCTITGNQSFPVYGRTSASDWYLIEATCQDGTVTSGWLPAELGLLRNPSRLPINVSH